MIIFLFVDSILCAFISILSRYRVYQSHPYTSAPGIYNTIKAVGKNVPDINGEKKLGEYCKIPCGRTVMHRDYLMSMSTPLCYNEYIVFDQDRIRIKFILHCERGGSAPYVAPTIRTRATLRPISSTTQNVSRAYPGPSIQNQNACVIL